MSRSRGHGGAAWATRLENQCCSKKLQISKAASMSRSFGPLFAVRIDGCAGRQGIAR